MPRRPRVDPSLTECVRGIDLPPRLIPVVSLLGSHRLPLGTLYRWYKNALTYDAITDNADQIFAQAAQLTQKRGAILLLVFLTTPAECLTRTFVLRRDDAGRIPDAYARLGV